MKRIRSVSLFWILLIIGSIVVTACTDNSTEEPPPIPQAQRVTITLQPPPFLSQTPRFTATLTPSSSPTPSDTPTASNTPTPITPTSTTTATATSTLGAVVNSPNNEEGIRVREGPDAFQFGFIQSLPNQAEVGVLGKLTNERGELWYNISFANADGEIVTGWMRSDFIDIDELLVPDLEATSETTATSTVEPTGTFVTAPPFESATPEGTVTPLPTGSITPSVLSAVNIRAAEGDRGCRGVTTNSNQSVSIYWSWWVTQSELMQDHIAYADYDVQVDGRRLENWRQYRTEMFRDPQEDNNWTVYWYVPIGRLNAGTHTLEYNVTWSETVNDGLRDYGPGTERESDTGSCTFTVTQAGN